MAAQVKIRQTIFGVADNGFYREGTRKLEKPLMAKSLL
jgi:hypothetical protein